jgi:hypothetical protein
MSHKINSSEIDSLIEKKIKERGLVGDITLEKLSEIKEKIKSQLKKPELVIPVNEQVPPTVTPEVAPTPVQTLPGAPEAITQTVSISKDAVELAKKEGELEQKEKQISDREASVANKESELQRKQDELSYKPQVPAVLENIGNEQFFIFNENELSLGAEALSSANFRLMSNPDLKKSMIEIWATDGKKSADVFLVRFEKIGEVSFDPFQGTSKFEKKPFEAGQTPSDVPIEGLTPEDAMASQEATEPMQDSIEPISNVTLAPSTDMGLNSIDMESLLKSRLDDIIKDYFLQKYPKM